jgi:hypothetical protein
MCRFSQQLCMIIGIWILTAATSVSFADGTGSTRYGLFNGLDSRSKYATNWFPEPLQSDELDQDQEVRMNVFHAQKRGIQDDEVSMELEKSFKLLSIEFEVPYERSREDGDTVDGIGNIEFSARHPLYQYVSPGGFFDSTFGARVELGIATGSAVSKNTELVGAVFETIGFGDHFSIQASAGYSTLFGPGPDGGEENIESAAIFGYNLDIKNFLDLVRVTPEFEFDGETGLNHDNSHTAVTGAVGLLFAFDSIKWGQPKFQVGYVFPVNDDAKEDFDAAITMSFILEY